MRPLLCCSYNPSIPSPFLLLLSEEPPFAATPRFARAVPSAVAHAAVGGSGFTYTATPAYAEHWRPLLFHYTFFKACSLFGPTSVCRVPFTRTKDIKREMVERRPYRAATADAAPKLPYWRHLRRTRGGTSQWTPACTAHLRRPRRAATTLQPRIPRHTWLSTCADHYSRGENQPG